MADQRALASFAIHVSRVAPADMHVLCTVRDENECPGFDLSDVCAKSDWNASCLVAHCNPIQRRDVRAHSVGQ